MPVDYEAMKKQLPILKRRLTQAKKKGPDAVKKAVSEAFEVFERIGYPDNWSLWERAKDDAEFAQRFL